MTLTLEQLSELPSPFYRVGVKALILDAQSRLAVLVNSRGEIELPGGGLEHDETVEECVARELAEEMHARVRKVSPVVFTLQSVSRKGWRVFRVFVRVTLETYDDLQADDGMQSILFVTKAEFTQLQFAQSNRGVADFAATIWGEAKE